MRVLVTGSRNWAEPQVIHDALHELGHEHGYLSLTVVHGACPTGADQLADEWAERFAMWGVKVERHPADWKHLGKAAGPIRNEEMVQTKPDLVLAFLMPGSRGTADCIRRAERDSIPVRRFHSTGLAAGQGEGSV